MRATYYQSTCVEIKERIYHNQFLSDYKESIECSPIKPIQLLAPEKDILREQVVKKSYEVPLPDDDFVEPEDNIWMNVIIYLENAINCNY